MGTTASSSITALIVATNGNKRMALKNYTTKVPASRSIQEIQDALLKNGATAFLFEYEQGTGRIAALKFRLFVGEREVPFALPVNWRRFQQVLVNDGVSRSGDEDYVYRVAWRNIRDWVLAQLALYQTEIVEMPQIFLPFAVGENNETLYEKVKGSQFLLGSGN